MRGGNQNTRFYPLVYPVTPETTEGATKKSYLQIYRVSLTRYNTKPISSLAMNNLSPQTLIARPANLKPFIALRANSALDCSAYSRKQYPLCPPVAGFFDISTDFTDPNAVKIALLQKTISIMYETVGEGEKLKTFGNRTNILPAHDKNSLDIEARQGCP